jgi:hypothetical protein
MGMRARIRKTPSLDRLDFVSSEDLNREPTPCTGREMLAADRFRRSTAALLLAFVALCVPLGAMATESKRVLLLHSARCALGRQVPVADRTREI